MVLTGADVPVRAPWPWEKFKRNREHASENANQAVMVLTGAMSPAFPCHLLAMAQAKERLERAGFEVVGGWLSPSGDDYVAEKAAALEAQGFPALSVDFRLHLADLAVEEDDLLSVASWQALQAEAVADPGVVLEALREAIREEFGSILCRVFHVCGSSMASLSCSKGVRSSLGYGSVVVPQSDDAEILLERPTQHEFVADPVPGLRYVSSSRLMAALRLGDVPFVTRLLGPVARLLLAPTDEELVARAADYRALAAVAAGTPLGCALPTAKFAQRLAMPAVDEGRVLAVIVADGAMNPAHRGHVRMLWQARERLERAGYHVVGAWLAPCDALAADAEASALGAPALSADFRRHVASLAASGDEFVEVAAGPLPDAETPAKLLTAVKEELMQRFEGSLRGRSFHLFYACGADVAARHRLLSSASRLTGIVVVPRSEDDVLMEDSRRLLFVADADASDSAPEALGLSSTRLRADVAAKNLPAASSAMNQASTRFLLAPTPSERWLYEADFDLLGVEAVTARLKACFRENVRSTMSAEDLVSILSRLAPPSLTEADLGYLADGVRARAASGGGVPSDEFVDWMFVGR